MSRYHWPTFPRVDFPLGPCAITVAAITGFENDRFNQIVASTA